ncbi:cysteinyl-tRNA synthetase [Pleurotus ostreatus]|uniref:Cysteinyl-tRNA synthetase n=1 Tax=Pleurotus ostreatus TaxID=5322 RepID=A0A8H6ZQJ3_PLEOS|nr:cysteinyl-tRNA synthetase [Pleurotus ostreatus]KAF7427927.1 cysteinyl-tRNA synthetase [Pleurotus ostreatus]
MSFTTTRMSVSSIALKQGESVDDNGRAIIPPDMLSSPSNGDFAIAPWLQTNDEPPTPPPKTPRSMGFAPKPSFSSFNSLRQASVTSLLPQRHRSSESNSIGELTYPPDYASTQSLLIPPESTRKSKPSVFSNFLKKSKSKSRLRSSSSEDPLASTLPPPLPEYVAFHPVPIPPSPTYSIQSRPQTPKKDKKTKRKGTGTRPPCLPPKEANGSQNEITLDTNLDQMDGIIDPTLLPGLATNNDNSSPSSAFDSHAPSINSLHHSDYGSTTRPSTAPSFSNPFLPISESPKKRPPVLDIRKVSPTSIPPRTSSIGSKSDIPPAPSAEPDMNDPSWTAPESWAVGKEGEDSVGPDYSSEEDSAGGDKRSMLSPNPSVNNALAAAKKDRRRTVKSLRLLKPEKMFKIRIHRATGQFHIVTIGLNANVATLTTALSGKLLQGDQDMHRLYLKERGRERVMGQKERPADIFRRRLEQAGYDAADGLETLGEDDMSFLLKFVYKSQLLGPAEEDLTFDGYELVDLTGRSLRTIPVALHQHADEIISLKLSRNPMLEIPLDFIQSCTQLRELRLSNMAMKKVPQSVRHSLTLRRLDLSCNRIVDLDDAGLDRIPELMTIFAQNNRMEKLPWYFPRLRILTTLNISNNKFQTLPAVVSEMTSLTDLDISFNMISELPDEIGQLKNLGRFIIVGNQVSRLPASFGELVGLGILDCRRNQISDLSIACTLPKLEKLSADHNALHGFDLALGPCLTTLDASHNEITQLSLLHSSPTLAQNPQYALISLDISHAKLSSLEDQVFLQLSSLQVLKLDYNSFRSLPETLGELSRLEILSCCDNNLDSLPQSIGKLQCLELLDAHNNSLIELPASLWNCASLTKINVTSNLLGSWHDPPPVLFSLQSQSMMMSSSFSGDSLSIRGPTDRKPSTAGSTDGPGLPLPPLAYSLEKLYLGENRFTDDVLDPLTILKNLRVLNLSFNEIQDMPPTFFKDLTKLEELYLSGNKLTSLPTEDLNRLKKLSVLFLNGNRLQTLPQELGKVQSLTVLDVGNNLLKYNINNWEFDWNWNFNKSLKYLNLSGNKKLQIKSDIVKGHSTRERPSLDRSIISRQRLSGFTELTQLRVLGLMDVTITTTGMNGAVDIPDESEDRRVRTSSSTVNGMPYGIADTIGRNENLNMLDLMQEFRGSNAGEAVFGMFGHAHPPKQLPAGPGSNKLARYLRDNFLTVFQSYLAALRLDRHAGIPDALRRTFLRLNKDLHDSLFSVTYGDRKMSQASGTHVNNMVLPAGSVRNGASGIVLYFVGRTMYVANVGNALAVVSRHGGAQLVSRKHDPFDRKETARIRAAEGWVSPPGLVNDEVDVSRSFGFYHLLPVVNARPDVVTWELSEQDEFVIVGNRGLWDYVSYQTAVDIARSERADPMIAAQKLRDFAISYGAEGSMMIMVIGVADLFDDFPTRSRLPTLEQLPETYQSNSRRKQRGGIADRNISRLDGEVPAPTGHLALVFTDIRNSTHLWEVNPGMPTAMRLHNNLLRRQLRFCGGYEVKTEGDAFMCSFPNVLSAVWWCLTVQVQLLQEQWPLEILECEDGKEVHDSEKRLVARGLSVRMGIHCGHPICDMDPVTHRMDYFGPVVNRSARINSNAQGGQIMCSIDVIREIEAKILDNGAPTEYSDLQPVQAIEAIRRMGVVIVPVGEVKLKGLETPEMLSMIYPAGLETRQGLVTDAGIALNASTSRVQFSATQMRELGMLCLRLEALSTSRIFRPLPDRKASIQTLSGEDENMNEDSPSRYVYGNPHLLLPSVNDKMPDNDLMMILDSLSTRIENSLAVIGRTMSPQADVKSLVSTLSEHGLDERTLQQLLSLFSDTHAITS